MTGDEQLSLLPEKLRVNIPSIDAQHLRLYQMTEALCHPSNKTAARETLSRTLADLVLYIQEHFTYEESILEKYGYPALSMHRIEHKILYEQVVKYVQSYQAGTLGVTELIIFLKGWYVNHIGVQDQHYAQFLRYKDVP